MAAMGGFDGSERTEEPGVGPAGCFVASAFFVLADGADASLISDRSESVRLQFECNVLFPNDERAAERGISDALDFDLITSRQKVSKLEFPFIDAEIKLSVRISNDK